MIKQLCDDCLLAAKNTALGQGHCLRLCAACDIRAAADYINNQNRKETMETIKSKRTLHSKIKEILEGSQEPGMEFPHSMKFCEGMGMPIFNITIDRNQEDHFIDEKGQKWVKA